MQEFRISTSKYYRITYYNNRKIPLFLCIPGIVGFDPSSDVVIENAGTLQVCARLLRGQVASGETLQVDLTLFQGVTGTAEGKPL